MKFKKFDLIILTIFFVAAATLAYGASYVVHDFGTGIMHEAKDVYRTNTRSVETDIASNEVRITSLQTKADSTENALEADKANLSANYDTTATVNGKLALKANSADVYSKIAADLLLANKADISTMTAALSLKANAADVYTTAAVDLLLNAKLDVATISNYYLKTETFSTAEIIALLAPKANAADVYTTGEINLMLTDYETTGAVTIHIADKGAHGFPDPTGQPLNRLPVTNGAGGWDYTSFGAAGAGVTNAVDLIVASPAADGLSSHNQQAFDDTVAAQLTTIHATNDSQDIALNARKIQGDSTETALEDHKTSVTAHTATVITTSKLGATNVDDALETIENNFYDKTAADAKIAADIGSATAEINIGSYSNTAAMNAAIAAATAECQAKTWTPLVMANGAYTGEVIIDTVAASQTVYNVVYSSSTGWAAAKADSSTTLPALGMALETGTGNKKIFLRGILKNTSWNFTKGNLIYTSASTAGAITAVKPSTAGQYVQIIGVAIAADTVYFNFGSTFVKN